MVDARVSNTLSSRSAGSSPATRTNDLQTTPILPLRLFGGRDTNRGGGRKDVGTSERSGANDTATVTVTVGKGGRREPAAGHQ